MLQAYFIYVPRGAYAPQDGIAIARQCLYRWNSSRNRSIIPMGYTPMEGAAKLGKVNSADQPITSPVLVVDLTGTFLKTDLLLESLLALLHQKPQYVFVLPRWLLRGKAYLKQQIARRVLLDVSGLPYRKEFLQYLERQRAEGRSIVLATANDEQIACQVADHLKLFDLILASDGTTNFSGESRRDRLVRKGSAGFSGVRMLCLQWLPSQ